MKLFEVDLYNHFTQPKPDLGAGMLSCYIHETPDSVSPSRLRPGILILPGGGYGHVSRREGEPVALRFAAMGYNAFVLEYSVAPHRFPTALREASMAMAYIRGNARKMETDSTMIAAIGFSAGGHLCGCLGTMYDAAEVADIAPAGQLRPDALGLCYSVAVSHGRTHAGSFDNFCGDDADLRIRLSLDRLVRPDMPPVFLWHTRSDETVPCRNSLILADKLQHLGVDFALHMYRSGKHGLSTADHQAFPARSVPCVSADVPGWLDSMAQFFAETGFCITDLEEME